MAVPTIVAVSPSSGPAVGGNIVVITGTNFNVAYDVTAPYSELAPVRVRFNSVASSDARVISATEIWARAPAYTGVADVDLFPAVAVEVANLDTAGVVIPGEIATAASAYTYTRLPLVSSATRVVKRSPFAEVLQAFTSRLQRQIVRSASLQTHVDYGEDGEATVVRSTAPSIAILADWTHDEDWSQWDNIRERKARAGGDGYDVFRSGRAWLCSIELRLSAEHLLVAAALQGALLDAIELDPFLSVPGDADWDPSGTNRYPLDQLSDFKQASNPSNVPLYVYVARTAIRGVRILPQYAQDYAADGTNLTATLTVEPYEP